MGAAIVVGLEVVCERIDALPEWTWRIPLLHRLGCPRGLALLSSRLDERWGCGEWNMTSAQTAALPRRF